MNWIKKNILNVFIIFFSSFLGVCAIEIGLRLFYINDPWKITREANILRNFEFQYDITNLYSSDFKFADYKVDKYGLRDNCKNVKDIKVLTVGGSTTDQRYVPFEFTFQTILQQRLRLIDPSFGCISNAGVDGHSTHGHIYSFKNWFPLIDELKPEFILLYIGVNDADFSRNGPNSGFDLNDKYSIKSFLKGFEVVRALLPVYRLLIQKWTHSSAAYSGHIPDNYTITDYTIEDIHEETPDLTAKNAKAFKLRLATLLNEIEALSAIPICVTQPHRYATVINDQLRGIPNIMGGEFSGIDYDYSIKRLNKILFELCKENTLDLYSMDLSADHFYDGVHTTAEGSILIGDRIADFIIQKYITKL